MAALALDMMAPIIADQNAWPYIPFWYIFFAAVLPMWLLKRPRDYMTTFMCIGMIAGAVVGLLVAHPTMNLPVFTGFHNDSLGDLFPILFVTVACGAVSGFHSLVSSGTSSKTVSNEKDMLKVGYGAMVLESLLATLRAYHPHRLVVVFGCGGNRSRLRRYGMGEICAKMADFYSLTEDNNRLEKAGDIPAAIRQGT